MLGESHGMSGFVYIANGDKPVGNEAKNQVNLTNMSLLYLNQAVNMGYKAFIGIPYDAEKVSCSLPVEHFNSYIYRNPLAVKDNYKAYKTLNKEIKDNNIQVIHCNTPVGGLVGRLSGKKCKVKKVIYQAHGFHFYKGAPIKNWLLFYPIEKLLARWTDAIITINKEDFESAKKLKLRNGGKVYYVHGVGIDTAQYMRDESIRRAKRKVLNIAEDDIVLLSAGELNSNKNNRVIIEALSILQNKKIHYFLCGKGNLENQLKELAEDKGISENVHFLGYRKDIKELYCAVDVFVMPSFREGLSRAIMEAMSAGLPCVVSNIRGNVDLIEDGKGGFLCKPADSVKIAEAIGKLAESEELRVSMSEYNKKAVFPYDVESVRKEIKQIYTEILID